VRGRVLEAIQRKVEGANIVEEPTEAPQAKILDLMDALRASLARQAKPAEEGDTGEKKKRRSG
jgi:non-homologous end joining protein Ku